ncbi:uncharacterized protein LOC111914810 isoform X1 [Lactuca sativa]|uniref:Uncharacterized protein n=2 Tax=Lactuca sativa TaxID=4236 RepID=A0A9R1X3I4_LACSA|nr:uncharacterized protein LOC111914810 isoform X1 [Lactuca sativa]KAJ0196669.1 hypothetical protein LSAT_V11C700382700 [Lactuca sativa]
MAHEEHTSMCSNGRLSKKLKNKKLPQRGMGVAQLEKIISEEHQKNDVTILAPNSNNFTPPPPSMSIALPPPMPPNHHRRLIQITDATNPVFVSKPMHSIINGGRLWIGGDYRFVLENPNLNPSMSTNRSDLQRSHLFQQPCSSLMIELPSNQSNCSNNYHPPLKPHEEKMIGMKRPYPFSKENMPIPSFNLKFPFSSSYSNGFREKKSSNLVAKDFLTLVPPQIQSSTLPQQQGQTEDVSGSERSNEQPFYSFFPAAKNHGNNNGEEGEHVDLSLKL